MIRKNLLRSVFLSSLLLWSETATWAVTVGVPNDAVYYSLYVDEDYASGLILFQKKSGSRSALLFSNSSTEWARRVYGKSAGLTHFIGPDPKRDYDLRAVYDATKILHGATETARRFQTQADYYIKNFPFVLRSDRNLGDLIWFDANHVTDKIKALGQRGRGISFASQYYANEDDWVWVGYTLDRLASWNDVWRWAANNSDVFCSVVNSEFTRDLPIQEFNSDLTMLLRNKGYACDPYGNIAKYKAPPATVRAPTVPKPSAPMEPDLRRKTSFGSGFFVSDNGYLITNFHVVQSCSRIEAMQDGVRHEATIIANDQINDLSLLKINHRPSQYLGISDSEAKLLDEVYVAGFPFGEEISSAVKVTKGIVSALSGIGNNYSNMQIDAALQPGNSGGPVLNKAGEVVGVAVAKLDLESMVSAYGVVPEDTNFAIKSFSVRNLLSGNGIAIKAKPKNTSTPTLLSDLIPATTALIRCGRQ